MPKQTITISSHSRLTFSHHSLIIERERDKFRIPLEDIELVLIDNQMITISARLISELCNNNIPLISCNSQHLPNGLLTNLNKTTTHAQVLSLQMNISKPLKKQVWKSIVVQKIENQAKCLAILGFKEAPTVAKFAQQVKSGDTSNRESCAAREYFRILPTLGGRRTGLRTPFFDYGYAILRAALARSIVSVGLLPSVGVHHHNLFDTFPLADDFIEPFRPLVDLLIVTEDLQGDLTTEAKQTLAKILEYSVCVDNKSFSCQNAINRMIQSYLHVLESENASALMLPSLLPLSIQAQEL
ncbi:type II CRISPR-associated endonuclease Cas1 [Arcanobacterium phocae]|uniref:type II CRISPR-associated endonuclease Cas1 n=1 Tax=Arcanobacterium phocae TaxID=131112 RepID=UPI001C0EAF4D|nr:type II CRISPR-associated endonuclease Cas1 [Arcanobacterium phocae]